MKPNDGGPAFPLFVQHESGDNYACDGMSLRDYFAAKALVGWISNHEATKHEAYSRESLVIECYLIADAMLKAREEK